MHVIIDLKPPQEIYLHANKLVDEKLKTLILNIEGVENVFGFAKYQCSILIGKAFVIETVAAKIIKAVFSYYNTEGLCTVKNKLDEKTFLVTKKKQQPTKAPDINN